MNVPLSKRLAAEALGTAFLLMAIVGSGIMGERLAGGNIAIALLANSLATVGALFVLIVIFAPISGAHFNPAVTFVMARQRKLAAKDAVFYVAVQVVAAFVGVALVHAMFNEPLFFASMKVRTGWNQWLSEFVATFGLLMVIWGCSRFQKMTATGIAVAAYIGSAYWFTSSTSFANPAVTFARAASDTFAGIRPDDVVGFVVAQMMGATAATFLFGWLGGTKSPITERADR